MRVSKPFTFFCVMVLGTLLFAGWFTGKFAGTDVEFQSSDGEWARPELRFKGEDFEYVVTNFEWYRSQCSPTATLQRTTVSPNWRDWDYWFNDYSQPKWKVGYAVKKHASSRYPPYGANHCANKPSQPEQMKAARQRAKSWL